MKTHMSCEREKVCGSTTLQKKVDEARRRILGDDDASKDSLKRLRWNDSLLLLMFGACTSAARTYLSPHDMAVAHQVAVQPISIRQRRDGTSQRNVDKVTAPCFDGPGHLTQVR